MVEGHLTQAIHPAAGPLHQPAAGPPPRTGEEFVLADPERALAVSYAPARCRAALTALFALDERMGGIVATTSEPMIGLMRLAWWREAFGRLDHGPAPAEPLLGELQRTVLPRGVTGTAMSEIEGGWAALLEDEPASAAVERHGRERGGGLFALAGMILGAAEPRLADAGAGWALADLGHRHSSAEVRGLARARAATLLDDLFGRRWPGPARPLAMLAALARRDAQADATRRQGSPARLARMLALRLTGR